MKPMSTRVLVIDDDKSLTDLLISSLDSTQYEVIATNSGKEGIEAALTQFPDIIVLDLVLPGVEGWQIGKAIRDFSKVPILVLSAFDKPGMVALALDGGADDYLIKPVSIDVLVAQLNKLTRRTRAPSEAISLPKRNG